jgi:hypothetical protein
MRAVITLLLLCATAYARPAIATAAIEAAPLEGPTARLDDFCYRCKTLSTLKARAPFTAARLVASAASDSPMDQTDYYLALETGAGWFYRYLGTSGTACGFDKPVSLWFSVPALKQRDVLPGGGAEMLLVYDAAKDAAQVELCGLGASGVPSCTKPLSLAWKPPAAMYGKGGPFGADGKVSAAGYPAPLPVLFP